MVMRGEAEAIGTKSLARIGKCLGRTRNQFTALNVATGPRWGRRYDPPMGGMRGLVLRLLGIADAPTDAPTRC